MIKVSGKKHELPKTASPWTFEKRPGGWIVGTRREGDQILERVRFHYTKIKNQFFFKATKPSGTDFYGEYVMKARGGASGGGDTDYTAQFPGRVRKLMVKEGSAVTAGTPLLMVEAMKMEFAIKAGSDGVVKKFQVQEGTTLSPGQKLLDFEEKK